MHAESDGSRQRGSASPVRVVEDVSCRAIVLTCIDYRFVEPLHRYLHDEGLSGASDVLGWPGGAFSLLRPDRDPVVATIRLALDLHHPSELILTVHEDCGAIGGSGIFPGHQAELSTLETSLSVAAGVVAEQLPDIAIRLLQLEHRGPVEVHRPGGVNR